MSTKVDAASELEAITGGKLTLGKTIWAIRTADEIRQIDFARKLGISVQQLCDIEHDRKNISPQKAASYAKKLGYSEEQFIRLSIQDSLDRAGLNVVVDISSAKRTRGRKKAA